MPSSQQVTITTNMFGTSELRNALQVVRCPLVGRRCSLHFHREPLTAHGRTFGRQPYTPCAEQFTAQTALDYS